jgi:hypothetical protein
MLLLTVLIDILINTWQVKELYYICKIPHDPNIDKLYETLCSYEYNKLFRTFVSLLWK